jgi:hypothetical protein
MKLLSNSYRKIGFYLLFLSLPIAILIILGLKHSVTNFELFWGIWGTSILYYPLSTSLLLISFSECKLEDHLIKKIRITSFFWGIVSFATICLFFPLMVLIIESVLNVDLRILFPSSILSSLNLLLVSFNVHFYLSLKVHDKNYVTL